MIQLFLRPFLIILKTLSSETFIRSFQFKFLGDIFYSNVRFAKIGYVPKDTCTFWEADSETICHVFYECLLTQLIFSSKIWRLLVNTLKWAQRAFATTRVHGEVREKRSIELFRNPAKLHIWSRQHCAKSPDFDVFKEMVDIKYCTEKCIASENNMERKVFLVKMFSCNSFTCLWKQVALLLQRLINWCWWNECVSDGRSVTKLNFVNYETTVCKYDFTAAWMMEIFL